MANILEFDGFKGNDVVLLRLAREELAPLSQALGSPKNVCALP